MELKDFLHMKEGDGELSYAQNTSITQQKVASMSNHILETTIQSLISKEVYTKFDNVNVLRLADLGCGVGPVTSSFISMVIQNVKSKSKELNLNLEVEIYLNDLPSNDFNSLIRNPWRHNFKQDEEQKGDGSCGSSSSSWSWFLMVAPGSFYRRLFPRMSMHLIRSNYALHWLSKVPPSLHGGDGSPINKGNIYISETSPPTVARAFYVQFLEDFNRFLHYRSAEVVPNCNIFLTFRGRSSDSNMESWQPWELKLLTLAFYDLVSQGMIKEETLDSFDFPYYGPSKEEIQDIVEKEGSFTVEHMQTATHQVGRELEEDKQGRDEKIVKFIRAFSEPLISKHFGAESMDALYDKLSPLTFHHLAKGESAEHFSILVLLNRKAY